MLDTFVRGAWLAFQLYWSILVAPSHPQVWECLLDYEAFRTDKTSDMFDVPKIKDGSVLPWCFGKYQHVRLHCNLQ